MFLMSGEEHAPLRRARFAEWHHFYLGVGVFAAGVALTGFRLELGLWVLLAGALVMIDDGWQHLVQAYYDADYLSPLAWLFHFTARRLPFLGTLSNRLDRLF